MDLQWSPEMDNVIVIPYTFNRSMNKNSSMQNYIIKAQADALAQVGAVVLEEERADVGRALTALIGRDETPDEAETLAIIAERSETDGRCHFQSGA